MNKKILIIDDEINILELLRLNLEIYGYEVYTLDTGENAIEKIEEIKPNLILLDLMLPYMNGVEICNKIRKNPALNNIRIIILSAKSEQIDKVVCLEMGADDYITKPFGLRELIARIGANFRRINEDINFNTSVDTKEKTSTSNDNYLNENNVIEYKDLKINPKKGIIYKENEVIELTVKELKLLLFLLENKGNTVTREKIIEEVWQNNQNHSRSLDVHIRKLRKKLDDNNNSYIETVRGIGYIVPKE